MKKLLLAGALFAAMSGPAMANTLCHNMGDMAEALIKFRNAGNPMQVAIQLADDAAGGHEPTKKFLRATVMEVYGLPRYRTPENQRFQLEEYTNSLVRECYMAMESD